METIREDEDDDDDESDGMLAPSLSSTTISDTPLALEQLVTIAIVILTMFGSFFNGKPWNRRNLQYCRRRHSSQCY